ncbi:MAG: hypothetical protein IKB73_07435 [Ruminococcus sp.]|nr:hypothetical protein [Ruminococcus sp.]
MSEMITVKEMQNDTDSALMDSEKVDEIYEQFERDARRFCRAFSEIREVGAR